MVDTGAVIEAAVGATLPTRNREAYPPGRVIITLVLGSNGMYSRLKLMTMLDSMEINHGRGASGKSNMDLVPITGILEPQQGGKRSGHGSALYDIGLERDKAAKRTPSMGYGVFGPNFCFLFPTTTNRFLNDRMSIDSRI